MEEGSLVLLSLPSPSFTSVTESALPTTSHGARPPGSPEPERTLKPGVKFACGEGEECLASEENFSLISETMSVTSSDQEKLLLLNKNMELRRVNQELMKLNEEWDTVYRNTTVGLQHRIESLVQENAAAKQLNKRLLLKVEHQQSAREYYEQILLQELKKSHDLQDYVSQLEGRRHQKHAHTVRTTGLQGLHDFVRVPEPNASSTPDLHACPAPPASGDGSGFRPPDDGTHYPPGGVQDLKEQLDALRCQTQIYEAEFRTEHKDHKNTLQENRRLRRKREEMRQQVALLQEQLKVYEDDFRKERSDKQVLQRLLVKKNSPVKDPVLVHRCNNEEHPPGGDKRPQSGERAHRQNHLHCPLHCHGGTHTDETFGC